MLIRIAFVFLVVLCGVRSASAESNAYIVIPLALDAEIPIEWYPYCFTKLARIGASIDTHYFLEAELCSKQPTTRRVVPRVLPRARSVFVNMPIIEVPILSILPILPHLSVLPSTPQDMLSLATLPGLPTLPYLPGLSPLPVLPDLQALPIVLTFR